MLSNSEEVEYLHLNIKPHDRRAVSASLPEGVLGT